MNKETLVNNRCVDIAHALRNIIEEQRKENEIPFVVGWEERTNNLEVLEDNIKELFKHPRKNKEILYFLNELASSYYL